MERFSGKEVKPIAIPGIHEKAFEFFKTIIGNNFSGKILEIGAGYGAFTKSLKEAGYNVSACDIYPEIFSFEEVECKKANLEDFLPYDDNSFDIVIAIEVMEHITDKNRAFSEINRIMKKEGIFFFTTPNILSLKSRLLFLLSGYFYSFGPLDYKKEKERMEISHHISPLSIELYKYLLEKNGFFIEKVAFDKWQKSSLLLTYLYPLIYLFNIVKFKKVDIQNSLSSLLGRILFVVARKI